MKAVNQKITLSVLTVKNDMYDIACSFLLLADNKHERSTYLENSDMIRNAIIAKMQRV